MQNVYKDNANLYMLMDWNSDSKKDTLASEITLC